MKKCVEQLRRMEKSLTNNKRTSVALRTPSRTASSLPGKTWDARSGAPRMSMEKDKATGTSTQGSGPLLERARTGKEKDISAKAKVKVNVKMAEKDSEKARAKEKEGALQPRH